tara:strand:- start:855 stop:2144 length:1290 start_codon:yes stop_codon:yes gene_type:complete
MLNAKMGIARRFGRALALHLGLVAIAVILGIFAADWIIEDVLVKEALTTEASHYWDKRKYDPAFSLPDTKNLKGYRYSNRDDSDLPIPLRGLDLGFHEFASGREHSVALVTQQNGENLLLVFNAGQVQELALLFGLAPLGLLLFAIYGSLFVGYRLFRSSVSPVVVLAKKVEGLTLETLDSSDFEVHKLPDDVDQEIISLSAALNGLIERIENFVTREREFTRNVSHELRTPLTVITIACDLLAQDSNISDSARNSISRIKRASENMTNLIETFLLISRQMEDNLQLEQVSINQATLTEIELIEPLIDKQRVDVKLDLNIQVNTITNEKILSGVLGNLLRNAANYTNHGYILVKTIHNGIVIKDTGVGMSSDEIAQVFNAHYRGLNQKNPGHGIGMTIARKLADRFGWDILVESKKGDGTIVTLLFESN